MMALVASAGSWAVRTIAFSMLPGAPPDRYGGFILGLSLPIPVVQVAPHWYAILGLWCTFALMGLCGWQATRELRSTGGSVSPSSPLIAVFIGYAIVALILTFFSVALSIDGYYYVLFGRLFGIYGIDPYSIASQLRIPDGIFAQEFPLLHNPPFPDPYGPGFTLLAGIVGKLEAHASLFSQLWTWRIVSVGATLLILAAVARLMGETAPAERARSVAAVAFHPLVLYESGVGGHNDFLMIAAAIWSYALVDSLPLIAGLLLGIAISIKYFAAVILPFVAIRAARKSIVACALVVVLAALVPVLCFHPFTFGTTGQATLVKVGSSLSMSLNWLLALPLFWLKASDAVVRALQLVIVAACALVILAAVAGYARKPGHGFVFRSITALLWSLPAMHPWYAAWLAPAAAARSRWSTYTWWFAALSLLVYGHEAVLPTPINHAIFVVITILLLVAPIMAARRTSNESHPHSSERAAEEGAGA